MAVKRTESHLRTTNAEIHPADGSYVCSPLLARMRRHWKASPLWHLPLRLFYLIRRRLVARSWYRKIRDRVGPVSHVSDLGPGLMPQQIFSMGKRGEGSGYTAVEPHPEYVEWLLLHNYVTIHDTAQSWVSYARSLDVVVLGDVIEHLEKSDGINLLVQLRRKARAIVIVTPLGYAPYDGGGETDCWGLQGQHWQKHRSGWTPEELPGWTIWVDAHYYDTPTECVGAFCALWIRPEQTVDKL